MPWHAAPRAVPLEVEKCFWDTDPASVDVERHRDDVMARGGWADEVFEESGRVDAVGGEAGGATPSI